jgi:hypothetical protein
MIYRNNEIKGPPARGWLICSGRRKKGGPAARAANCTDGSGVVNPPLSVTVARGSLSDHQIMRRRPLRPPAEPM